MSLENLESKNAQEVLKYALEQYGSKVGLATSFGAEDVVLMDMLAKIDAEKAYVFTLGIGRIPYETYDVWEAFRKKYPALKIEMFFPETKAVEDMVNKYGPNLFYESIEMRKLCCNVRKVGPLKRALSKLDAWITGLRREQSVTRTEVLKVENDAAFNLVKFNPLADWSKEDVWNYIKENDVPYNALHDKNYPSIGCAPCTRAVQEGEDVRAGRWWWETPEQKECGLHAK
jgi:phosphoadenosine phosphosulfate reductase